MDRRTLLTTIAASGLFATDTLAAPKAIKAKVPRPVDIAPTPLSATEVTDLLLQIKQAQTQLSDQITKADSRGLDVTRECMVLHTSTLFVKWADIDSKSIDYLTQLYSKHPVYKTQAQQYAHALSGVELQSTKACLEEATATLKQLQSGAIQPKPAVKLDYRHITQTGRHFLQDGKPVFVQDYTWKPDVPELTLYFGNLNNGLISPAFITSESGEVNAK
ncbi:MAG: hypothetical protein WBQ60_01190, partial [Asticcacaulis sp.]